MGSVWCKFKELCVAIKIIQCRHGYNTDPTPPAAICPIGCDCNPAHIHSLYICWEWVLLVFQEPFSTQEIFVHWCLLSWRIQFPYFIFNPKFFRLFKLYLSLCCRNLRLESWFVQCPTMHSLSDWKLLSKRLFISNSLFPWDLWTKHWKWIWM